MRNQKNTFVSLSEQLALLNKNSVEVITKLNDVVTSRNSVVNVSIMNSDGTASSYQLPTVGQLKNELDIANRNIKKLAGLTDSTAYVNDGTTYRRIYVDDLNREPSPVDDLGSITNFSTINNSFFESLSNPMLAIEIDLNNKIDRKVSKVLSRRYIINFQKDQTGELTTDGQISKTDFISNFLDKTNVVEEDLLSWYNNTKNYGVVKSYQPYDEQIFDLNYNELEYYGIFDVVGFENDTINKKMWYQFSSIIYYDYSGKTKTLGIGDNLIINKEDSSTKWQIKEISTAKSNYRVRLERTEGVEPVPILSKGLKIYSRERTNKKLKISIGYDEYNVIFIKPINTVSNIVSSTWSYGTCFFSNDLVLDTNNTVGMTKFYSDSVLDYGTLLKDMIVKNIPSKYGTIPNTPILDIDNFKVVQINKHLTDNANSAKIKNLQSQKTSIKSQLEQLNESITEKNKEISTKQFKSTSDKQASQNDLNSLIVQQTSLTKSYTSIVSRITAENTSAVSSESAKFRIRGFWSIPDPIVINSVGQQQKQEVVQFKVQYRYSAKGGSEPTTEGFKLNITESIYTNSISTGDITEQKKAFTNPSVSNQNTTKTGYFSNWNEYITPARKRSYNKALDVWTWTPEDVTDANTPNINQLDVAIQQNEKVEIRILAISEVGWPTAPIESEWSELMMIEFPDDLSQIGNENNSILKEAQQDAIYSQIESNLNSKGLTSHLQQAYYVNDLYVAHSDSNIGSSFKDSSGNVIMLNNYLKILTDRLSALEDIVMRAKGELVVKLLRNSSEVKIENGASVNITVRCEEYAELSGNSNRTYYNNIYSIDDYYLQFENISQGSQLGLLSYRKYVPSIVGDNRFYNYDIAKGSLATYVNSYDQLCVQQDNQFLWISDSSGNQPIYSSGQTINGSGMTSVELGKILYSKRWNVGVSGRTTPDSDGSYTTNPINLFSDILWTGSTSSPDSDYQIDFPVTVHPYIENINNFLYSDKGGVKLINPASKFTLPIKIYFKLTGDDIETMSFPSNINISPSVTRKMRIFTETENSSRPFEFEIIFKIFRNKTINTRNIAP